MSGIKSSMSAFQHNNDGVSLVETALVLPIIMMLLAGLIDFAMAFSAKLNTQQAAARTMEYATSVGLERVTFEELRTEAAQAAKVPESQVEINRWLECNQARQSSFDGGCEEGQEIARHVNSGSHDQRQLLRHRSREWKHSWNPIPGEFQRRNGLWLGD